MVHYTATMADAKLAVVIVSMPLLTVSCDVPYHCQFASADRVRDLINGDLALTDDPNWRDYGAESPEEYAHWALRSCGVVCVKMAVEAVRGEASGAVMDWVREGLSIDGYLTEIRPDRPDQRVEKGWLHDALVQLAERHGVRASRTADLKLDDLAACMMADQLVIASVTSELGDDVPITRSSGHLVVVTGVDLHDDGAVRGVIVHNPSGREAVYQAGVRIPAARFEAGFSGRGIVVTQ